MFRILALGALFVAGLGSAVTTSARPVGEDLVVLHAASARMANASQRDVLAWLKSRPAVGRAAIGRDGRTVSMVFRDGLYADILPRDTKNVRIPAAFSRYHLRPLQMPANGSRAVVLEPFATELGMGPNAGDPEVNDLQQAGFAVDQGYDTNVTVATMATLPQYSVVYMHTHSGVDSYGRGVLATGEPANGDPSVQPYLADGSVVVVGVAGGTQNYYAITSTFLRQHEGQFGSSSLLFLNGCALLSSSDFWQALAARGVGVLVSWDHDAQNQDDYLSAAAFFHQMDQGLSVQGALQSLYANGYGVSTYQGQKATLGYLGGGGITLQQAAGGTVLPPVTSTPTNTAVPTSTPTATATRTPTGVPSSTVTTVPTATNTPLPSPTDTPQPTSTATATGIPMTGSLRTKVRPGSRQSIDATYLPDTNVRYRVVYPNGDTRTGTGRTDSSGTVRMSFVQPASKITRATSVATVTVDAGSGLSWAGEYTIEFGAIDVAVQPRSQTPGGRVAIWIHARAREDVTATVRIPRGQAEVRGRTGAKGWAKLTYRLPVAVRGGALTIRADAHQGSVDVHSATQLFVG
jgi:hypothetical protein